MIDFDRFDDFDWQDIGLAGVLGEELADDEEKQRQIEKDHDLDQEDEENF
jgi:hypothetical protein